MKRLQRTLTTLAVLAAVGGFHNLALAGGPIPVVDDSNIAQQAKTYAETMKVVTNTAQQITLQLQELKAWPEEQLNKLNTKFDDTVKRLEEQIKKGRTNIYAQIGLDADGNPQKGGGGWDEKLAGTGVNLSSWKDIKPEDIRKLFTQAFPELGKFGGIATTTPGITGGVDVALPTATANQEAATSAKKHSWGFLSKLNAQNLASYQAILADIASGTEELSKLVQMSGKATGSKQVMQVANQISAVKARIDAANSYLQAVQGQHEVMKHQAEIQEKINDKKQAEASAKAETEAVKKIVNEKSIGWGDDPWVKLVNQRGYAHMSE